MSIITYTKDKLDQLLGAKLDQATADGIYAPLNRGLAAASVIPFGDSRTAQDISSDGVTPYGVARGYLTWALAFLGNRRPHVIRNAGVGGDTTTLMLARIDADVLSHKPGWVIEFSGTNDINQDVALATVKANKLSIWQKILASGSRLVLCTEPPTDYASTAQRKANLFALNDYIRAFAAATPGVVLCDWHRYLADPSTGAPLAAYFWGSAGSRVHQSCDGAARMGRILADAWRGELPVTVGYLGSNEDVANTLAPSAQLLTNGTFQGSGGTISAGTGGTGTVATGWTLYTGDGAAGVCAASVVARTDGVQGNWQQLKLGPANGTRQFHLTSTMTGFGTNAKAGDTVYLQVEVDADNDWASIVGLTVNVYLGASATTPTDAMFRSSSWETASANPCYDFAGNHSGPVLLRSPQFVIPANADRLAVQLGIAGDAGTIRFASAELRKVTTI